MKKLCSVLLTALILMQAAVLSAYASVEAPFEIYTMETGESSEYGYMDYKFVDADGNEPVSYSTDYSSKNTLFYSSNLPSEYDSRDYGYITSVKNQGSSGNCWAFSTLSSLEADSVVQGIDVVDSADYSEAHLVWFSKNSLTNDPNDTASGDGCTTDNPYTGTKSGGNWLVATEALARWSGLAEEADYPFNHSDYSLLGNYDESSRYDTGSGIIIKSSEVLLNALDVKQWIMEHGSATATYYSDSSYYNYNTYAYYYSSSSVGNHQITIVGWDDNYSAENFKLSCRPSNDGAWLCKNSWGSGWGLDGYFWLSYEDVTISNFVGHTSQKANEFCNNYSYNGAGYTGTMSGFTSTANVFKAKDYESLSAVSTYTVAPDTSLTISIYKDLPSDYKAPNEGTLASTWTVNILREGYHTIELPTEVVLKPGTVFSVEIKVQASGSVYIPVEQNSGEYVYASNPGESFMNIGGRWADATEYASFGIKNFCIQAFTKPVVEDESGISVDFENMIIITPINEISYIENEIGLFDNAEVTVIGGYTNGNTEFCGTGAEIAVFENDEHVGDFTVALAGDLNSDGVCDVLDTAQAERAVNGHSEVTVLQAYAANGCVSDTVDVSSYQNVVNIALAA